MLVSLWSFCTCTDKLWLQSVLHEITIHHLYCPLYLNHDNKLPERVWNNETTPIVSISLASHTLHIELVGNMHIQTFFQRNAIAGNNLWLSLPWNINTCTCIHVLYMYVHVHVAQGFSVAMTWACQYESYNVWLWLELVDFSIHMHCRLWFYFWYICVAWLFLSMRRVWLARL